MDTLTVSFDLPRDLLGALDVPQEQLAERLRRLIVVALFQAGKISTGKCAEVLGISKLEFVQLLAEHVVNYFAESPEELNADVKALKKLLDKDQL